MVEWASGGYARTFDQSAANGKKEPILPDFCSATKVCILWDLVNLNN
jgi:hypothetical protein